LPTDAELLPKDLIHLLQKGTFLNIDCAFLLERLSLASLLMFSMKEAILALLPFHQ
jgi:hypothetical protein